MTIEFRTPELTVTDGVQGMQQILRYLYQLVNQLNYAFSVLEAPGTVTDPAGLDALTGTAASLSRELDRLKHAVTPTDQGVNLHGTVRINGTELEALVRRIVEEKMENQS